MSLLWPILRHAIQHPSRLAVIDDSRRYSFAKLAAGAYFMADRIARATEARHVGLMLPTSGAFPVALLGAWLAGKVAVPLNYLLAEEELRYVIDDADIDTIVTAKPMLDFLAKEEGGKLPVPDRVDLLRMEEVDFSGFPTPRWPPFYGEDDLAVILYTSGTSGRPKGVMLTHGNLSSNVRAAVRHAGIRSADKFLGVLPQFHSFGMTALTLLPLSLGSTVVYTARFIPRRISALIEEHRPEVFMAVPSMYGALLSVKGLTPETFRSVRIPISGGEPLPRSLFDEYLTRFNLRILEGYGLTETSPITHWSTPDGHRLGAVGRQLPCTHTFIVDDQGKVLGEDQEGEIVLAGSNVMAGYYKLPEQTAATIFEMAAPPCPFTTGRGTVRAFRTGDIGKLDGDGYLYITGRKKEMLIVGGENVFPREIEEVLEKHPSVKSAAVIGVRDDLRGEVPMAFVELQEGAAFDEGGLRNHARQSLAQFKVPREIRVVEQLPRSPTGKVLRRKLQP